MAGSLPQRLVAAAWRSLGQLDDDAIGGKPQRFDQRQRGPLPMIRGQQTGGTHIEKQEARMSEFGKPLHHHLPANAVQHHRAAAACSLLEQQHRGVQRTIGGAANQTLMTDHPSRLEVHDGLEYRLEVTLFDDEVELGAAQHALLQLDSTDQAIHADFRAMNKDKHCKRRA